MKKFILQYKHATLWIAYIIFYLLGFIGIEHMVTTKYHIIHVGLDDMIPFCELFVIPYLLWFPYIAGTVIYLLFTNKKDYYKSFITLAFGMTLFLVISFFFPNGHNLRPDIMPRDNIFTWLVAFLYAADTSTNILPSIHVYNSFMAHAAIIQNDKLGSKKWIRISSFILCISIVLSTMFIKQHSMVDVITGTALAVVMYVIVYHPQFALHRRTAYE